MKTIVFVRHGESEGNAGNQWQGAHGHLTERGRQQAELAAARLSATPLELIVSSPLVRAKETAEIIAQHISAPIEFSDLFVERRKASEQVGMSRTDPSAIEIDREIIAHFGEPGWRHSDEENFEDMRTRGLEALTYLTGRPERSIAVVTHGYFMRVMLACALSGERLTPELCEHFITSFRTANAGISTLYYNDQEQRPWWLWTWNDHAHLIAV